jgi:hypothetical protein
VRLILIQKLSLSNALLFKFQITCQMRFKFQISYYRQQNYPQLMSTKNHSKCCLFEQKKTKCAGGLPKWRWADGGGHLDSSTSAAQSTPPASSSDPPAIDQWRRPSYVRAGGGVGHRSRRQVGRWRRPVELAERRWWRRLSGTGCGVGCLSRWRRPAGGGVQWRRPTSGGV